MYFEITCCLYKITQNYIFAKNIKKIQLIEEEKSKTVSLTITLAW